MSGPYKVAPGKEQHTCCSISNVWAGVKFILGKKKKIIIKGRKKTMEVSPSRNFCTYQFVS